MSLLVGCESSGTVRDAFRARGIDAYSCDLLPDQSGSPYHIVGDVLDVIASRHWDALIAHPPCTYLCCSAEWAYRDVQTKNIKPGTLTGAARRAAREKALTFVFDLWNCGIDRLCIENPVGVINSRLSDMPKPQYIQPYDFGEDASKRTGLWIRGFPLLRRTRRIAGRQVEHNGKLVERWANQTDSGQNRLGPSEDRWQIRSNTYPGIADAMADQWSRILEK